MFGFKTKPQEVKMRYKIVVDSCCDMTPEMEKRFGVTSVPINLQLGDNHYIDDKGLDIGKFLDEMSANKGVARSAAPSPAAFTDVYDADTFVVTVTGAMSATHQSAQLGTEDVRHKVHVFDSKTASAGQTLATIKLHELIESKIPYKQIIDDMTVFIDSMKTYLVLEKFDNLINNGRLSKTKAALAGALSMKLVLGADGEGKIDLYGKVRGQTKMLQKLVSLIEEDGRSTDGANAVISHTNNPGLAKKLADMIKEKYNFKEIFIVPTKGTAAMYTDNQGIVLAF